MNTVTTVRLHERHSCLPEALVAHAHDDGVVKSRLAGYKVPKRVLAVETIGRSPTGKVDYPRLTQFAKTELAIA